MSKVQLSGRINHFPGAWGNDVPVRGAIIEVLDVDPGGSDDVIWTGTTDFDGRFSATSGDWQDSKSIQVWIQDSVIPPRGHWETKEIPDPSDLLILKIRITQAGRSQEVFPFLNNAPAPVLVEWGPPAILTKETRALVVLNNTVDLGDPKFKQLYQFIETSGDSVARSILGPYYKSITSLNGSAASTNAFCAALSEAAKQSGIKAVDAIINMHGGPGTLFFSDGGQNGIPVAALQQKLVALGIQGKLRLAYNTSCFGASHAYALCSGGFNATIGSQKVNANSASEYPVLLSLWAAGASVADALAPAQAAPLRKPMDAVARRLGFTEVDSYKTITGNPSMDIQSAG